MNDFIKVSPLKLLEMSSGDGLGKGNLGVLIARAGVGKTACLICFSENKNLFMYHLRILRKKSHPIIMLSFRILLRPSKSKMRQKEGFSLSETG